MDRSSDLKVLGASLLQISEESLLIGYVPQLVKNDVQTAEAKALEHLFEEGWAEVTVYSHNPWSGILWVLWKPRPGEISWRTIWDPRGNCFVRSPAPKRSSLQLLRWRPGPGPSPAFRELAVTTTEVRPGLTVALGYIEHSAWTREDSSGNVALRSLYSIGWELVVTYKHAEVPGVIVLLKHP